MGIVGDIWNRITGRKPEEEALTRQQKGEQNLAAAAARDAKREYIAGQNRANERDKEAQDRASSGRQAKVLEQPRPADRMVSYKDLFAEPTRQTLKEERDVQRVKREEIAKGERPPIKSYTELHPNDPKTPQR